MTAIIQSTYTCHRTATPSCTLYVRTLTGYVRLWFFFFFFFFFLKKKKNSQNSYVSHDTVGNHSYWPIINPTLLFGARARPHTPSANRFMYIYYCMPNVGILLHYCLQSIHISYFVGIEFANSLVPSALQFSIELVLIKRYVLIKVLDDPG